MELTDSSVAVILAKSTAMQLTSFITLKKNGITSAGISGY